MTKTEKLFIMDGNNWFTRNYFTEMKTMQDCIERLDHFVSNNRGKIIWAFDTTKSKRRLAIYPEYKAGRKTSLTEEEYKQFVGLMSDFRELIINMGFNVLCGNDYEADDYIAVAVLGYKKRFDCYIVSTDKDFLQLVDEHVFVLKGKQNGENVIINLDNFTEEIGVGKEYFLDYKCMVGDASDNVGGIVGIGETTASKYIDLYGHYSEIKKAIEEKISESKINRKVKVGKTEMKFVDGEKDFLVAKEICDLSIPQNDKELREIVKTQINNRSQNMERITEILLKNSSNSSMETIKELCSRIR